jgi:hypothetical protein
MFAGILLSSIPPNRHRNVTRRRSPVSSTYRFFEIHPDGPGGHLGRLPRGAAFGAARAKPATNYHRFDELVAANQDLAPSGVGPPLARAGTGPFLLVWRDQPAPFADDDFRFPTA